VVLLARIAGPLKRLGSRDARIGGLPAVDQGGLVSQANLDLQIRPLPLAVTTIDWRILITAWPVVTHWLVILYVSMTVIATPAWEELSQNCVDLPSHYCDTPLWTWHRLRTGGVDA